MIVAFLKKGILHEMSYRFAFLLEILSILFFILTFYFITKLFGKVAIPYLESYGGDYFSFVLIGIAFSSYMGVGLGSFSGNLRSEQMMGTLEAMLVTPTRVSTIIFSLSAWNFIYATAEILIYLLLGTLLFGVDISNANIGAAFLILFLTLGSFTGFGIISASFIMILKRGDPVNWILGNVSDFLGGVYFPITILPPFVQVISHLLPITYALRAIRHALLQGYSFKMLLPDILVLVLFCVIVLPLSIFFFKYAVKRTKLEGTLSQY